MRRLLAFLSVMFLSVAGVTIGYFVNPIISVGLLPFLVIFSTSTRVANQKLSITGDYQLGLDVLFFSLW